MKKNFFKRSMKVVLGVTLLASVLGGCNEMPVEIGNEAPTVTVAPTNEVLEPTKEVVEPTKEVEPTVVPTEEPEVTEVPLLSPEPVITEEPEATPAFSLTVVPTPTEAPVATEEPEPTVQPTEQPTATVAPTATTKPTSKPKATATPKPTSKPKATATPKPTSGWGTGKVNKNAKNYKFATEELGLPGDLDSKYVFKNEYSGDYYVYIEGAFDEDKAQKINKTVYTTTNALADKSVGLDALYDSLIDPNCDGWDTDYLCNKKLEKGQELTAVAYYPEWNIYKVKTSETKEYFVFGGQVSEKKPSGLDVHEYLAMELEDGEYVVTGLVAGATETNIIIPSEINGTPVTKIADGAFDVQGKNFTVTLPETITYIGNRALKECKITNTTLPKALEYVGMYAFDNTGAEFKSLPQSVTNVGEGAFIGCTINKVVVPSGMTKVPDYAFIDCTIKELTLHDNITRIGKFAFNTLELGEDEIINLPKKLTYIGDNGIWGNYGGIKLQGKMPEHLFELRGEVDILVDSLVSDWEKKYGKLSDLEYTLLAFDWVTKNVNDTTYAGKFLQGESITTVGEAMLNGRANCHGYMAAARALLDRANVENYIALGHDHDWNVVIIDGVQYHMDTTWGVFLSSDKEFLNTGNCKSKGVKELDCKAPSNLDRVVNKYGNAEFFTKDGTQVAGWAVSGEEWDNAIIPNCPKSFPSDKIASAKARLGLK